MIARRQSVSRSMVRLARAALCVATGFGAAHSARAQTDMPLTVHERLWIDAPGPAQAGPGAPRLLIVYPPDSEEGPTDPPATRYAGRVEPAEAKVTLNGEPVTVWPGGVFTGIRPVLPGQSETWRFKARDGERATEVERTVTGATPPLPAPSWPLTFFAQPVSPVGEFLLPPGKTLPVTLYASAGHRAEARIGENGPWMKMEAKDKDPQRGGVYQIVLTPPEPRTPPGAEQVFFRLSGEHGDKKDAEEWPSSLRIGGLDPRNPWMGRVAIDLATYLKDADSWDRWGNWIRGTPFPVLEWRPDRIRTGFGRGETGWVETSSVDVKREPATTPRPELGEPKIEKEGETLTLSWPAVGQPVACVFHHEPNPAGGGDLLRVSLPGAASLPALKHVLKQEEPFESIQASPGDAQTASAVEMRLRGPLWGYAMEMAEDGALRLVVRGRPRLEDADAERPLAGLRVMIDAGHGGRDLGERGPSGLAESDVNLVQAAWLERDLAAMGAEIRQVRRQDEFVELDARVEMARQWKPDLFISLHHNSVGLATDPFIDAGPRVFFHYPHSRPLAEAIAGELTAWHGREDAPRVEAQVFRVMRNVTLGPSVLVETAFVCNPKDEVMLRRTETIKTTAQAIAKAVETYLGQRRDRAGAGAQSGAN